MPGLSCRTAARGYYTSNSVRLWAQRCLLVCERGRLWICVCCLLKDTALDRHAGQNEDASPITPALNILWRICRRFELSARQSRRGGALARLRISNIHAFVRLWSWALMVGEPVLMIRDLIKALVVRVGLTSWDQGIRSIPRSRFNETSGRSLSVMRKLTWTSLYVFYSILYVVKGSSN